VSGKFQIYMLPAMPFLIFAAVMSSVRLGMGVWVCLSMVVPASVFVLSPVVVAIYDRVTNGGVVGTGLLYLAASGLAVAGGYCLYLAFSGKKVAEWLSRSVCVLSASLLWVLFVAGWGANEANGKIGYAKLCEKAQELGRQKHISNYYAQGISRPENMDVYLHRPINELPDGSLKGFKGPALLLTSREDLGGFVGCEKEIVGDYAVVVLNDAADGCSAKCKTMCRECGRQRMSN
ncbi:MAG: hypothetical protein ACI4TR_01525, partial [Bacteroidaceae bacterium]